MPIYKPILIGFMKRLGLFLNNIRGGVIGGVIGGVTSGVMLVY